MGTVPDYQKFPYQEDKILSRDHEQLADYIKNLVQVLGISYTELAQAINDIELGDPESHHTTHEDGGNDEVGVAGLSGELADAQIPKVHKTSHQNGGGDEIGVAGLSGLLADEQNAGKIKAKPVDAPLAADDGKALTYDHTNTKYKHTAFLSGGGNIVTGTYTGDGSTGQAITGVGFRPKYLKVWPHPVGETNAPIYEKTDQTWGDYAVEHQWGSADQHRVLDNRINSLDADGFTVDDDGSNQHPNKADQVYDYVTFG